MKILVDSLPNKCMGCLFLGEISESNNTYSGCTLLKIKIPFEIGITTRITNCPLSAKDEKISLLCWEYEDRLPDLTNEEYDAIYKYSKVIEGVRMFPFIKIIK